MSKLFFRTGVIAIALAFPGAIFAQTSVTLSANSTLNLDTGATGTGSSGDILWTGNAIQAQGSATDVDLASTPLSGLYSGAQGYSMLIASGPTLINEFAGPFGSDLTSSTITPNVNDIIIVKTNLGNYSAILITNISGGSLTLQYDTFSGSSTGTGTGTTPSGPTINAIVNNYGNIPQGLPSYGIAPASLFVIYGTGLSGPASQLQSSAAPGLPTTLNQTSVSVTVNGTTVTPALYYTSPTQIDAVLPSKTPTGNGTITVTYNGAPSNTANILVTQSAFGIDTLSGTGSGTIVATVGASIITPTNSAAPNQTITIWGSGLGADTANADTTYPQKQDNIFTPTVYIGGVQAQVSYAGRSQYPGVDQINVAVPSGLSGCGVSVVVIENGIDSNFGSLPINAGGGVCSDPELGVTGSELEQITSQSTVRTGSVILTQSTAPSVQALSRSSIMAAQTFSTSYDAFADFSSTTGSGYASGSAFYSLGSCFVSQTATSSVTGTSTSNGLDAGSPIVLTGGGLNVQMTEQSFGGSSPSGSYFATLTQPTPPLVGGTAYTFTGPGGKDVGPFTATITFPSPLTWTNESSISAVTEAQGQLITWTGGATGTYVIISGDSTSNSASGSAPVSAGFTCLAPVSAGQFTVPAYVLLALPHGTGSLGIYNYAIGQSFTATGIDYGTASAGVSSSENVTYQ